MFDFKYYKSHEHIVCGYNNVLAIGNRVSLEQKHCPCDKHVVKGCHKHYLRGWQCKMSHKTENLTKCKYQEIRQELEALRCNKINIGIANKDKEQRRLIQWYESSIFHRSVQLD